MTHLLNKEPCAIVSVVSQLLVDSVLSIEFTSAFSGWNETFRFVFVAGSEIGDLDGSVLAVLADCTGIYYAYTCGRWATTLFREKASAPAKSWYLGADPGSFRLARPIL